MYLLILLLPLISAMMAGLFGRKLGEKGANFLTCTYLSLTTVLVYIISYENVLNETTTNILLWPWLQSDLLNINMGLQFDKLTAIMLIVVTSISTLVHIYSTSYMQGDPHLPSFMSHLSLFTFFMMVLVTSNNFLQLFMGWEGVGMCSYLLINFWYTGISNNKCAIKAMILNSMGDMGLLLAMFAMWYKTGSLNFSVMFSFASQMQNWDLMCIFMLMGAVGKSAQLGLHSWLPDAMAGPTPVSALIHAATMVTAGVFIMISSSPMFELASLGLLIVATTGALTAFFAASMGLFQNDMKKMVAYSTCSQLGYMVVACGVSNYSLSLFHLSNHAFFKALLFLSAGSVMHAVTNDQDMSKMGALKISLPLTYIMILMGSLSLMGFPFLTGFYSKDLILELAFSKYYLSFTYWLMMLATLLTAFYSMSLIYMTFFSEAKMPKQNFKKMHEGDWQLIIPLLILALGSMFIGFVGKTTMLGVTNLPMILLGPKLLPLLFTAAGTFLAIFLFYTPTLPMWSSTHSSMFKKPYVFMNAAWQFDFMASLLLIKHVLNTGHTISYKLLDKGLLELCGPTGMKNQTIQLTHLTTKSQSGLLFNYALFTLVFIVIFLLLN